jgi:hypothetical protein
MTPWITLLCGFILTAPSKFGKATKVTEIANSSLNDESSVADAFRSPPPNAAAKVPDGLRVSLHADQPLLVRQIEPKGWAAFWAVFFPAPTVVELSGKFNATLYIYPTHVQIEKRRWLSKMGIFARYTISIPIYDEIGDAPKHQLHLQSALAFLYPFVPMHVQVTLDDEVAFGQGKFEV